MNNILKVTITLVDGRGGGNNFLAQGGGRNNGNLESSLEYALSKIWKKSINKNKLVYPNLFLFID